MRPVRDDGCGADAGGVLRGHPERRPETGTVDALGPQAAFLPRALRVDEVAPHHGWALRHPLVLGGRSAHGPRSRTPLPSVPSAAPAHHQLRPDTVGRTGTGPKSSACVSTPAGEDRCQTPQRVAAAGRGARCTCKLKDTGLPPGGGARSSDGVTAKPDLSPRVAAVPGRGAPSCNSAIDQHTPWPGPGRERTYRPVTATVVSLGRAPARPSDARRRRWRRDTTFTVGPYPGGDAPPGSAGPTAGSGLIPSCHTTRRSPVARSGVKAARPPTRSHAVVRPTPRPCRAHQGIAARPLRAGLPTHAPTSGGLTSAAARRVSSWCRAPASPDAARRGRSWGSAAAVYVERRARCHNGGPAALIAQGNAAGRTPRGSGLRRGNDGRVSGRTCPERTRRPTRR
ncbi:hypothetical protein MILU53160_02050 [Micrococcus luteus]